MARKRPEEDLYAAFYDGAPGDYGTTSGTSRQSIRDILAEEVNQRARTGTVDTAEMEPEPEPEPELELEYLKEDNPHLDTFKDAREYDKKVMKKLAPKGGAVKELKKKTKPKPQKKKKTEAQVTKAKPKAKEYTRQQKIDYTEKVTGKTFADMPKGLTPKERSDWLKTYTPFLKTPKKKKK